MADGQDLTTCDATVLDEGAMYGVGKDGSVAAQALRKPDEKVVTKTDNRGQETKVTEYSFPELWRLDTGLPLTQVHLKAGSRLYASGKEGLVAALDTATARLAWQAHVDGDPWTMVAANGRLLVVTKEGRLYCFGQAPANASPPLLAEAPAPEPPNDRWTAAAASLLRETGITEGYALVPSLGTGRLAEELARQSNLHVVTLGADAEQVAAARRRLDAAGLYGSRVAVLAGTVASAGLPPYFASLVAYEEPPEEGDARSAATQCLRPYGGTLCVARDSAGPPTNPPNAIARQTKNWTLLVREGPLPGAGSWTQQHGNVANTVMSNDRLVEAPLGLLWFGGPPNLDVLPRHGHGPAPEVIGGRLFIEGIGVLSARDVYTGRLLWTRKLQDLDTFGAYYNESYNPDPFDRSYNQQHIPGANEVGSNFVVTEDRVYVTAGPVCHVLDPATGATLEDFTLTVEGENQDLNWGYIGAYQGLLIATAAPVKLAGEDVTPNARFAAESRYLVVMDAHSGAAMWTREAAHAFRHNAIVAGGDKVFCLDTLTQAKLDLLRRRGEAPTEGPRLLALDIRTGKVVWATEADVFGTWLGYSEEHDILLQAGSKSGDRPADEAASGMVAYRGADGMVLWQHKETYLGPPILHHDRIITQVAYGTQKATPAKVYDLRTGQAVKRTHPLTGEEIPWTWVRFYGCNTATASENLLTFRSAAASFADLRAGQGTSSIGGFKSGCTSNLVAADGVLSAPDYTRTCTCSYQNQSSLALIYDPGAEVWSFDYYPPPAQPTPVKRLGLNLGAPGDRMAEDGGLFLEVPSVGGPSPDIPVRWSGDGPRWFRRHSALFRGPMNWIGASGLEGAGSLTIRPFLQPAEKPAEAVDAYLRNAFTTALDWPASMDGAFATPQAYTVRLYFAEPDDRAPGERVFSVALQGKEVLTGFDIAAAAGAARTVIVKDFPVVPITDDLAIMLTPAPGSQAPPVLCGVELLAEAR
jgi:outer membrane protein assembly factor BamB